MTRRDDTTRILISQQAAQRLADSISRRRFLALGGGVAVAAALAACGSSSSDSKGTSPSGGSAPAGGTGSKNLNMFTWAEYDDPDLLKSWGNITLTIFDSNEQAVQKLVQGGGSSGFDMVVPTGPYIPQLAKAGLLAELDKSKIPNFSNLDTRYINQPWDQGNKYSVCKNWGTTGWFYDTKVVTTEIKTWADFIKVAQTEASGKTTVLDAPPDLAGIYFWANGIDWTTEKTEDLDACEKFLVDEFASHIKAFNSYPGVDLTSGSFALSQVFVGDARAGLLGVKEAGDDPARYKWGIGAPETEFWMDNWCILKGAKNVDSAYDFINFILDPKNSVTDLNYHGYNTGIKDIETLAGDIDFKDMVFYTADAQLATMKSGAVNSAQERLVKIYSNVKAKAGG
jgi:spermidine/putrescine transport system substrate-binding protein